MSEPFCDDERPLAIGYRLTRFAECGERFAAMPQAVGDAFGVADLLGHPKRPIDLVEAIARDLKVTVQTDGATKVAKVRSGDVVVQHIVIGPGGNTGWHTHPGPVIVLIASGTITLYDGDDPTWTGHPYAAGQSFVDIGSGHVHLGRKSERDGQPGTRRHVSGRPLRGQPADRRA